MTGMQKSSFELTAEQMLSDGAVRVDVGSVVTLKSGYRVTIVTGWGAWDQESNRLVCTGKVQTSAPHAAT